MRLRAPWLRRKGREAREHVSAASAMFHDTGMRFSPGGGRGVGAGVMRIFCEISSDDGFVLTLVVTQVWGRKPHQ